MLKEDRKKKYLYLGFGYTGLILIGLAVIRYIVEIKDTVGYALTMFGYICLVYYFTFADQKIGATTGEKIIFRLGFLAILGIIVYFIY